MGCNSEVCCKCLDLALKFSYGNTDISTFIMQSKCVVAAVPMIDFCFQVTYMGSMKNHGLSVIDFDARSGDGQLLDATPTLGGDGWRDAPFAGPAEATA